MKTYWLFPLLALLIISCETDDNFPKATTPVGSGTTTSSTPSTSNAIPLMPTGWQFLVGEVGSQGNPNNYQRTLTTGALETTSPLTTGILGGAASRATSYTLGMAASLVRDTASYCCWLAGVPPSAKLQVGTSLTLKARVRLENVQGEGVSLAIQGDKDTQTAVLFSTTRGKTPIRGTADTEYSVTLPYTVAVDRFAVYFVMLPNTTGTVIISDVSVQVN